MNQTVIMNETNSSMIPIIPSIYSESFTWPTLARLVVSAFAVVTNLINVTVFANPKLKETSYKYLFYNSLSCIVYSAIQVFNSILNGCLTCESFNTYLVSIFSIYFAIYTSGVLAVFQVISKSIITLNTYCILTNRNWFDRISYKFLIILILFFPAVIFSFMPFGISIVGIPNPQNGNIKYLSLPNSFFFTPFYTYTTIFRNFFRLFLSVVFMSYVNILNVIQFRKRYQTRVLLVNESTSTRNSIRNSIKPKRLGNFVFIFIE